MGKLSLSFRLLRVLGLNYSEEEYGGVSLGIVIRKVFKTIRNSFLLKYFMNSALLEPISPRKLRPKVLSWIGCKVGKDVFIGSQVMIDSSHADLIELEDHVHIANRCLILCHQRDLSDYCVGDDYAKLKYQLGKVHLKTGCLVGMNSMVMPGVTIGEGAIVGAGSIVTKDIPAWTIAIGRPAKVIKHIPTRKENAKNSANLL